MAFAIDRGAREEGPLGEVLERPGLEAPHYVPLGDEVALFEAAVVHRLPILLQGPTGCGKTRFVRFMAWRLGRPLVTVACHDDLAASDLTGRFLVEGGETRWHDGPLTQAVRGGAIAYLDEVVEARQDTVVVLHPLADDRRVLPLEKRGELVQAHPDFQLVVSCNPGYQSLTKELKPSTRQRFVTISFDSPSAEAETSIVAGETGAPRGLAARLVQVASRIRPLRDRGLTEAPSTRLLVHAASLILAGIEPRRAVETALAAPLTDDPELLATIREIVAGVLG